MEKIRPIKEMQIDQLHVEIFDTSVNVGKRAAYFVVEKLTKAIEKKGSTNLILATGTSQFAFLQALEKIEDLNWQKISVFHLDEYKDMSDQHPASFRKYLRERILDKVQPAKLYFIEGNAEDISAELQRYENLLKTHPVDVACIGIGENGHIAFNDPAVANFNDPKLIKVVELDERSRRQQLHEGWFKTLDEVPTHALSLTIPAIMNCKTISCVVPSKRKAEAVYNTLYGPIDTTCPASILRTHPDAYLFLDRNSAARIMD